MGIPEIVEFARRYCVMIRIQGPDPKGLKMRNHAFHHYMSGKTTLSSSGIILPSGFDVGPLDGPREPISSLVVTVASIIEPFLSSQNTDHLSQVKPQLIPGAQIDIMVEGNGTSDTESLQWLPAELVALVDIPTSFVALQSLIGASLDHGWEVGWSLAGRQPYVNATQNEAPRSTVKTQSGTRIAILKLFSRMFEDLPKLKTSPRNKRGDLLIAMGAPFGVLSPAHFCNSISVGYVSNCYPHNALKASLLMADIRCLPGMEGSTVFGEQSEIVGMLTRPLRQRGSGAEVQIVIPWEAIIKACAGKDPPKHDYRSQSDPVLLATSSVCLVTLNDSVWASGVLLNNHGLVLTNAHLLEPFTPFSNETKRNHQNIRVRVDSLDRWVWCDATVVYVSKGPLDIALLQLESVPDKLTPVVMDFTCPSPGSKVYVAGHGLFGPRCDFVASTCVGVVSKVVTGQRDVPVMIETTAAVHPGGSGGAVLNSDGHMISLVTSNAKHGGGTLIPYLNFSIPCAALAPVLNFSKEMKDLSILEELDRPNQHVSSVWALAPPGSPAKPDYGVKGSKFARFIDEIQHLKDKTTTTTTGVASLRFYPSKL